MWQLLLDSLFPPRCGGCGQRGAAFCPHCLSTVVSGWSVAHCPTCDRPRSTTVTHVCGQQMHDLTGVRVVGVYDPPLRPALLALKFNRKRHLAAPLALLLARAWQARPGDPIDLITTVPMPRDRQRARGYNQSDLLAAQVAHRLRRPYLPHVLERTRVAPAQHTLNARDRRANTAGLFSATGTQANRIIDQTILLVDDILTTGATLDACASALRAAGARSVWGLVVARPAMMD